MSKTHFNSLNYTIGNEDTSLELAVMPENIRHVFAVAGSGSRIIPLLSKSPQYITCVDSSPEQLSFAELRIASLKALDHQNFLAFWGFPAHSMSPSKRWAIFKDLEMSDSARKKMGLLFEKHDWGSLLYTGRWEQTFQKLSRINKWIVGNKGLGIFACQTKKEQEDYLKNQFPQKAWSLAVFMLGNAVVFNTLLYKGNFPQKNIPKSMYAFYSERLKYLFEQDIARRNYFLQLLFFGRLQFSDGLPIECDSEIFLNAKKGLQKAKIIYVCNDAIDEAKRTAIPIDFLSFSDLPSYLGSPREQEFLQEVKNSISSGGIVVNRYYLRIPNNLDEDGYQNITGAFKEIIAREKIQMYAFGIYQKF